MQSVSRGYLGGEARISLRCFARWAKDVGYSIPLELESLAANIKRADETADRQPERVSADATPETRADNMPPSQAAAAENEIYRTGLPGRPTSWHLIEAECQRRFTAGERHPGKTGESPAEWARELSTWLGTAHPSAPQVVPKTLSNKLGGLLRKLEAREAP
jgi:hypothetical protein